MMRGLVKWSAASVVFLAFWCLSLEAAVNGPPDWRHTGRIADMPLFEIVNDVAEADSALRAMFVLRDDIEALLHVANAGAPSIGEGADGFLHIVYRSDEYPESAAMAVREENAYRETLYRVWIEKTVDEILNPLHEDWSEIRYPDDDEAGARATVGAAYAPRVRADFAALWAQKAPAGAWLQVPLAPNFEAFMASEPGRSIAAYVPGPLHPGAWYRKRSGYWWTRGVHLYGVDTDPTHPGVIVPAVIQYASPSSKPRVLPP